MISQKIIQDTVRGVLLDLYDEVEANRRFDEISDRFFVEQMETLALRSDDIASERNLTLFEAQDIALQYWTNSLAEQLVSEG